MNVIKEKHHLICQVIIWYYQEVGIICKNIYFLNDCFKDIEDNYNIIRLVNTTKYKFIIYVTYLPPNEEHNNKISELIEKLLLIQKNI